MTTQEDPSYVYFLFYPKLGIFKIGKANIVENRIITLSNNYDFDFNSSYYIEVPNEKIAYKIERTLQIWFKEYNIQNLKKVDGYAEFYSMDIFLEVKQFLSKFFEYIIEYKRFDTHIEVLVEENKNRNKKNVSTNTKETITYELYNEIVESIIERGKDSEALRIKSKENALIAIACIYYSNIRIRELVEMRIQDLKDWIKNRNIRVGKKNYEITMSIMLEDRLRDLIDFDEVENTDYVLSKGQQNRKHKHSITTYTRQLNELFIKQGYGNIRARNFYNTTSIF